MEFDLLNKTELRIERIRLQDANLNDIASAAAAILELDPSEILVTDVANDILTLDILREDINAYSIIGRQKSLLEALGRLPGVFVTPETSICSEGMLGWIVLNESEARASLKRSEGMAQEIYQRIQKRALVISTGIEVRNRQIEDTNKPYITRKLESAGFSVTPGPTLNDDINFITGYLRQAVSGGGYGLIVTTGGVGAELKDCTVEALLALDPQAATPYTCRFEIGTGRHAKEGVRIGVAMVSGTMIVALPGPNDEVKKGLKALLEGLSRKMDKAQLAEAIAIILRNDMRKKMRQGTHQGYL
jgi:molybdenum cofactor synthesis domain-containing protein